MRVAFISQPRDVIVTSGLQRGSVGIVTWELARRVARRHDVVIYAPLGAGQAREEEGEAAVRVRRIPRARRKLHRALELAGGFIDLRPPYFTRPGYFREYVNAVAAWLQRDPPDCVHVQVASQFLPVLRRAAPRATIVLHTHDELLTRIDKATIESRLECADAIVTCSDYITRQWQQHFPQRAAQISTIGNGVDLDRFHATRHDASEGARTSEPAREVLYVGRVSPEKGVHVLTEAFSHVANTFPDARLTIVGPAGLLPLSYILLLANDRHVAALREFYGVGIVDQLRKQVLHANTGYIETMLSRLPKEVRDRVEITGALAFDQLPRIYRRATVLAAPSVLAEPFGLPVVEALACGLPVVASRAGGMGDLVEDGVTGRVVERGNPGALAAALCEMLANPNALSTMSSAARLAAERRYSWDASVERLEAVYHHAGAVRTARSPSSPGDSR